MHRETKPAATPVDASELELFHSDAGIAVGSFRNVLITVYRGPMTIESLDISNRHHGEVKRRSPQGTLALGVTRIEIPIPPPEVRAHASDLIRRNAVEGSVIGSVVVLTGSGFWASAARSAMTAMFMMARQPYPSRVVATIEEGADFCIELGRMPHALHATLSASVRALENART